MKKTLCISLSVLIFIVSCGLTMAVSYCPMNEELEIALIQTEPCCCEEEDGDECCMEAQIKLDKLKDNYIPSDNSLAPDAKSITMPVIITSALVPAFTSLKSNTLFSDAKAPPGATVPRSILYRVFII